MPVVEPWTAENGCLTATSKIVPKSVYKMHAKALACNGPSLPSWEACAAGRLADSLTRTALSGNAASPRTAQWYRPSEASHGDDFHSFFPRFEDPKSDGCHRYRAADISSPASGLDTEGCWARPRTFL